MSKSEILTGTNLELWHGLVQHGEKLSGKDLPDELEHYLVTVFDKSFQPLKGQKSFISDPAIVMLRQAEEKVGFEKREALRFVGEACLMRAGFSQFVSRTFKKIEGSPRQFYINIGRSTFMALYTEYENKNKKSAGLLYQSVAYNLHHLVEVLSSIENNKSVAEKLHNITIGNVTYL